MTETRACEYQLIHPTSPECKEVGVKRLYDFWVCLGHYAAERLDLVTEVECEKPVKTQSKRS